jgi:hypothetical protein
VTIGAAAEIRGTTTAVMLIDAGTTLNVSGQIRSTSTATTFFPTVTINGTLNTSNYLNATSFTLGANAVLNTSFNGSNNTLGWWYTTTSPTTISINPSSTINYSSTTAQKIAATTYGNLIFSGSGSTKSLVGNTSISGTVTIGDGTTLALSTYTCSLLSTATSTANVAAIGTGLITYGTGGQFTLQQYTPGKRAFRFFGHPFTSTLNLSALTDNILITGGTGTGFTSSGSNAASAFWYNNTLGTEDPTSDIGWTAFTTADGTGGAADTWKQYEGIRVLVRGSISDGLSPTTPSAVTIDASGNLNTGTQTIALTKGANSGYNFVANPFASNILLDTTGANVTIGSNVQTNFYVWDVSIAPRGGWVNRAFTSAYILPSFSAFFVKTTATDQIVIKESAKTASAATGTLFRTNNAGPEMFTMLVNDDAGNTWDRASIYYDNNSSINLDRNDGAKMYNSDVNLYSIGNTNKLSIDSRPFVDGQIIPLGITTTAQRTFTISIADFNLGTDKSLLLHDRYTNTYTQIADGATYTFSTNADASSQGEDRLELVQKAIAPLMITPSFTIKLSPNPTSDKVTVNFNNAQRQNTNISMTSTTGQKIRSVDAGNVQSGTVTIDVKGLAKGVYYISLNNMNTQKLVVE